MTIASPCSKLCVLDRVTLLCIGCGRSGAEIAAWTALSPAERARLMAILPDRLAAMTTRRTRTRGARHAATPPG